MTKDQLYTELNRVNARREKRLEYAELILTHPNLFQHVLEITFMVDDPNSPKAAWVLEFVCDKNLSLILPHLNYFTTHLSQVHLDSAVRPVAKICQFIIEAHYSKPHSETLVYLSNEHKETITEACFNWLINDEKVAPKVYAMNCLYFLGKDFIWIHEELLMILEKEYYNQSAGFKAKARHIMTALKKP